MITEPLNVERLTSLVQAWYKRQEKAGNIYSVNIDDSRQTDNVELRPDGTTTYVTQTLTITVSRMEES